MLKLLEICTRVMVAPAYFSNEILGRTKCTLLAPNRLAGFNPSIKNIALDVIYPVTEE